MADRYSHAKRSEVMSRVRGTDTKPEIRVRSFLHRLGYRFCLHRRDLPGRPDIVLPRYRAVIFVHGCFWHQHPGCRRANLPETNREKWATKLSRNAERDVENQSALRDAGWKVAAIWECRLKSNRFLVSSLSEILADLKERAEVRSVALWF